jgi:hypothetical protein
MTVKIWLPYSPTFVDANGVPLVGAQLFFYAAGSSTKQSTYTTSSGSIANANPMILDANGRPAQAVWLTSGLLYKVGLASATETDPPSTFLWSTDNVAGINDTSSSANEWLSSGQTPTYISGTSFSMAGDQTGQFTVGRRLQIVDAAGTTYSTIKTSAFAAVTTITLTLDSGATLTAPLSSVAYGIANPAHFSMPKNDSIPIAYDDGDVSKQVRIEASGLTTATTRILTIQDKDLTVAGLADLINVPVRQTVLYGALDSSGYAAHLTAGAGLNFNISATSTPLVITYANGFGVNGDTDTVTRLTADASNQGSLAANNLNYITSTRVTDTSVTWGSTLAPPQYGYAYDRTKQSLLRFAGTNGSTTILDDYGNTWAVGGNASIATGTQIDGLNTVAMDGTGDYVETTNVTTLGSGSWTLECKVRFAVLPTAANNMYIINVTNGSAFGAELLLFNNAGTTKLFVNLSSNGSSNDIVAAGGTKTTWATATTYHIALVYDSVAGKYFSYVDGVVDQSITSASKVCAVSTMRVGLRTGATTSLNGNAAGFRFLPYCAYSNGTTFTAPNISTFTVNGATSSDFFSIPAMTMYGVTAASTSAGTNPTLTAKNVVYHGEQTTNASAVVSTVNYAYKGQYVSADTTVPAVGTRTSFSANIGVLPQFPPTVYVRNYTADVGFTPGMFAPVLEAGAAYATPMVVTVEDRNSFSTVTGSTTAIQLANRTSGVQSGVTSANWKMFVTANRGW